MGLRAVIFDWGGTLTPYADVDMADMWRMAARCLAPGREAEVCARLVAVEEASWARIAVDQASTTLNELLVTASDELGLDVASAVLDEAAASHLDAWTPHMGHDPEAGATLAALRGSGLAVGLLSNTHWPRAFHEHFLERDGLAEFIDVRCYTSELERTKPHPDAFAAVLAALAVEAGEAVFVGDRPYDDIHGAASLGMRTVLRPNPAVPAYQVVPDATIARLGELVDVVAGWRAAGA